MTTSLQLLKAQLHSHLAQQNTSTVLGVLGVFHCCKRQHIKTVPILQASLILIIAGKKIIYSDGREHIYSAGQMVLLPANAHVEIANEPDLSGHYLALSFSPSIENLNSFKDLYSTQIQLWNQAAVYKGVASEQLLFSFYQWLLLIVKGNAPDLLHNHRAQEVLLLLAQQQLAGVFFAQHHPSWKQRIAAYLSVEPGRAWRVEEVAHHFNCSEATLRRRLGEEHSQFRQILEDVRLSQALGLLQESNWPISRVSQTVGYESPSRFSERFKKRFGLTPQALRATRTEESMLSV